MSEWYAEVQSLIPYGQLEDRLFVCRIRRPASEVDILTAASFKTVPMSGSFPVEDSFLTCHSFQKLGGEIDDFLQCLMDLGWKRGLRPAQFDPSQGEMTAVRAHLEDMRKLAVKE